MLALLHVHVKSMQGNMLAHYAYTQAENLPSISFHP